MRKTVAPWCLWPCLALVFFTSCLGASMDISIRPNGSGRIVLEYRVSQMLESLGRLDGNERWPAIPVGRADMERSVARVPGLRLSSFSARDVPNGSGGSDLVTRAVLDFAHTDALLAFLDKTGSRAAFVRAADGNANLLRLVLLEPSPEIDNPQLLSLIREVSAGYEIRINLNVPANASLATVPARVPHARTELNGRNVSFAVGTGYLPAITDGLALEVSW